MGVSKPPEHVNLKALIDSLLLAAGCAALIELNLDAHSSKSRPHSFELRRHRADADGRRNGAARAGEVIEIVELDSDILLL